MSTSGHCCHYCGQATEQTCPECNALCCLPCGVNLCPLCVRIKLALIMRALSKRLVPWQHIESSMLPISYRQSLAQSLVISDYDEINMLTQR